MQVQRPATINQQTQYFWHDDILVDMGDGNGIDKEGAFDIAYGTIGGKGQFLLTWWDNGNTCADYVQTCWPEDYEWAGVWGTYIDPELLEYRWEGFKPGLFPITEYQGPSLISYNPPATRISYSKQQEAFLVVWQMLPVFDTQTPTQTGAHIRGAWVDYFVDDS